MTPLKSIKEHCLWCCNGQHKQLRLCAASRCPLFPYRQGSMPKIDKPSPLKAIRARCLDCVGLSPSEVKNCADSACKLYVYRFGHNPRISEATRAKQRERFFRRFHENPRLREHFSGEFSEDDQEVVEQSLRSLVTV